MIIEAQDVFFISDTSMDMAIKSKVKSVQKKLLESFRWRFEDAKFHNGTLAQAIKKLGLNIYVLWFDEYSKYFLAKQYFLIKKKPFFGGFDKHLDPSSPWFIMASSREFKDVNKWMD